MKKLFFLMSAMLVFTLTSFGQSSQTELAPSPSRGKTLLTGAIGLTFGSDKATVKSVLSTKGNYEPSVDKPNMIGFLHVSIGTKTASFVLCKFVDNKLYSIFCSFTPEAETTSNAQEIYDDFSEILTTKYGNTTNSFRLFDYPFEDKSEDWDLAIRSSKATINSFWFLPNKETGNCIILEIDKDFDVTIEYQSKALMDIAIEKQKSKDTNAF
jgi:hypothetical protein